jgi:diguanylate cyclase (GGDEF)-like protein
MTPKEMTIDWLYRLKKKILLSILLVLVLSILATMVFISVKLRSALVDDSRAKTEEIAETVNANLHHLMILRAPGVLQDTLEKMVDESESVTRAFVLNYDGLIVYSSDKKEIGTILDRDNDATCHDCHKGDRNVVDRRSVVLDTDHSTQRNITLIYNEPACYECHDSGQRITGKLVIDRSLSTVDSLISSIQMILFGSGLVCLVILVPLFSRLLSRGIDKYILEIFSRNEELRLLYVMVGRLSETLDMGLLREIVIEIFGDVLEADDVELILPRGDHEFSASAWTQSEGIIDRKKIEEDDPLAPVLQLWLDGLLLETEVSDGGRLIAMPVLKGEKKYALIIARKESRFDKTRLQLSEIIRSHIEVAFENARLYYIAITDELTKAFTKRHFRNCMDDQFTTFKKYGSKFSLLMMDLDYFKKVNDEHGHVVGDAVLQKLGEILQLAVRDNDLVFRYGGEEFAVILPDTDTNGAHLVAERIRSTVESTVFEPGEIDLCLTISLGISTCRDASAVRDVIVAADQALYAAKRGGRNRVVIADEINSTDV